MGCRLRQNDTGATITYLTSNRYRSSDMISDIQTPISNIRHLDLTSDIYIRRPMYNTRLGQGQELGLRQGLGYPMSEIYIGCQTDSDKGKS